MSGESDRAYLANHPFSNFGANVFRSTQRKLLLPSFALGVWAAIIPAYAQVQLPPWPR
jgi:hypothetical protein